MRNLVVLLVPRTPAAIAVCVMALLSGCPKNRSAVRPPAPAPISEAPKPHAATLTVRRADAAAAPIQLSLTLGYDDGTPFAGTATITDDTAVYRFAARGSVPVEVVAADFDPTGKTAASFTPDPSAVYSAHLYDANGTEVSGPFPILTLFFDLSTIQSFTLTGTIRKADNALIQPYSLSAP